MRRGQRSAHGAMSLLMTAAVAGSLIAAFAFKQDRAAAPAPERLSAPGRAAAPQPEGLRPVRAAADRDAARPAAAPRLGGAADSGGAG